LAETKLLNDTGKKYQIRIPLKGLLCRCCWLAELEVILFRKDWSWIWSKDHN
jgi:hypothetical protein